MNLTYCKDRAKGLESANMDPQQLAWFQYYQEHPEYQSQYASQWQYPEVKASQFGTQGISNNATTYIPAQKGYVASQNPYTMVQPIYKNTLNPYTAPQNTYDMTSNAYTNSNPYSNTNVYSNTNPYFSGPTAYGSPQNIQYTQNKPFNTTYAYNGPAYTPQNKTADGDKSDHSQPTNTLWVGNLPVETQEDDMRRTFERFGKIQVIKLLPAKFCAFVTFSTLESSKAAFEGSSSIKILGSDVKINWGKSNNFAEVARTSASLPTSIPSYGQTFRQDTSIPHSPNLWIGNVDPNTTEDELKSLFERFGRIERIKLLPIKNCAFINFTDVPSASRAKSEMTGVAFKGQNLKIDFGRQREQPANYAFAQPTQSLYASYNNSSQFYNNSSQPYYNSSQQPYNNSSQQPYNNYLQPYNNSQPSSGPLNNYQNINIPTNKTNIDPELKAIIDNLSQIFNVNPELENQMKTTQVGNPKFSFLFAGQPGYNYFLSKKAELVRMSSLPMAQKESPNLIQHPNSTQSLDQIDQKTELTSITHDDIKFEQTDSKQIQIISEQTVSNQLDQKDSNDKASEQTQTEAISDHTSSNVLLDQTNSKENILDQADSSNSSEKNETNSCLLNQQEISELDNLLSNIDSSNESISSVGSWISFHFNKSASIASYINEYAEKKQNDLQFILNLLYILNEVLYLVLKNESLDYKNVPTLFFNCLIYLIKLQSQTNQDLILSLIDKWKEYQIFSQTQLEALFKTVRPITRKRPLVETDYEEPDSKRTDSEN